MLCNMSAVSKMCIMTNSSFCVKITQNSLIIKLYLKFLKISSFQKENPTLPSLLKPHGALLTFMISLTILFLKKGISQL